jgi:hypothetical protein
MFGFEIELARVPRKRQKFHPRFVDRGSTAALGRNGGGPPLDLISLTRGTLKQIGPAVGWVIGFATKVWG